MGLATFFVLQKRGRRDSSQPSWTGIFTAESLLRPGVLKGNDEVEVNIATIDPEVVGILEKSGFTQDPDVLDTWFSSGSGPSPPWAGRAMRRPMRRTRR